HAIDFAGPAGKVRLLVGTHDAQRCTAWVGKGGAIPIAATGLPLAQLEPVFRDATEKTLRKRGVAIGSDGLQGLPEDLQVLRWHEARGEDLAALRSFSKLRQLD